MAYIAEQVEVDDSHNEVYVIGNKCFTLISQELNGTVVFDDILFHGRPPCRVKGSIKPYRQKGLSISIDGTEY